jgi:hypothetical protein
MAADVVCAGIGLLAVLHQGFHWFSSVPPKVAAEILVMHQLSWLKFIVAFLSPSRQMPGQYLKLGHDSFFRCILKVIIY